MSPTIATSQPDLASYDWILVNSSAGKDSQAMLDLMVELARAAGVLHRVVVVHADLGRVEWAGTRELAERQALHYGLRFEVVKRDRDLLHQIEHERKMFPDNARRFCTSDQKTAQVSKLITRLVKELGTIGRQARVLSCLGIRAQESPKRAKQAPFTVDKATSPVRHVDRWLPIHRWLEGAVWERIRASGVEHHRAYDLGMKRLSCCFCVLASKGALVLSAQHNPELAQEYVRVESLIRHRFRKDLSMADVVELARKGAVVEQEAWTD